MSESALTFAIAELGGPGCIVKGMRLVRSRDPSVEGKGFAFVEFYTPEACRRALEAVDGSTLKGSQARRVRASLARPGTAPPPPVSLPLASQWPAPSGAGDAAAEVWQPTEFGDPEPGELEKEPAAPAVPAAPASGFVFDAASGYFFDAGSGYFYDPASRLYGEAATGTWFHHDPSSGLYTAVGAAQPAEAAPEAQPPARSGPVIGSAPKLSAEALAAKEAEARRVKEAEETAARAPKATPVAGGRVYGGKMRAPRLAPPPS